MKKIFAAVAFAMLVTVFGAVSVSALDCKTGAGGVSIAPVSEDFSFHSGDVHEGKVKVKNISSENDAKYRVYTAPYSAGSSDNEKDFSTATDHTQISNWIEFEGEDGYLTEIIVSVPACTEKEVSYRVNVPSSVPAGSQHAVIFVETYKDEPSSGISSVSRAGMIVSGSALDGETIEQAEVVDLVVENGTLDNKTGIYAQSIVKNTGNIDIATTNELKIENIFGQELWHDSNSIAVLPDSSHKNTIMWEDVPMLGLFKVIYTVHATGVESQTITRFVFVCPLPLLIVVLVLVVIVIIGIITTIKKRRIRKMRYGF
ncbi:hypothetical protein IKH83_01870 [Candidatus Saccharibacteria bacterium]|nr:hypothetical protein [Candidatus Saccharibacteria bacterium]